MASTQTDHIATILGGRTWHHDFESGKMAISYPHVDPDRKVRGLTALLQKAEEMGVVAKDAIAARLRYLAEMRGTLERKIWGQERKADRLGCGPNFLLTVEDLQRFIKERDLLDTISSLTSELAAVRSEEFALKEFGKEQPTQSDRLTEAELDIARNTPIEKVLNVFEITFKKGMLKCPFHVDKTESASIKRGVLYCFAGCRPGEESSKESWDSIALYRRLEGVDYKTAVRALCRL